MIWQGKSARLNRLHLSLLSSATWVTLTLVALPNSGALAQCVPAAGPGAPPAGTTVTCTGAVTQNPPNGYGDGSQTGLAINVQNGASVSGDNGFLLNTANAINHRGAVLGTSQFGINSAGNVSVVNSGTITGTEAGIKAGGTVTLTNNVGGSIQSGPIHDGISATTVTGTNDGMISGGATGSGIKATTVTITNSGSISGHENGIIAAGAADVTNNGGSIGSSPLGNAGISAGTDATVVNSGTISGAVGIKAGQSANVTNSGTISALGPFTQFGISAGTDATVVNSGTITGTEAGIKAGGTVTLTNNVGGSIQSGPIHDGISATTVTGTNDGTINGGDNGIKATTVTITNSGSIFGHDNGIIATGAADVTNNGGNI